MATKEYSQEFGCDMNESLPSDLREAEIPTPRREKGGWITFPFIIVCFAGMSIGFGVFLANFMVYLITEFHVKSIDAAQISNVINGCSSFFPIIGAIIADSFFGPFSVISVSSFIAALGMALLVLTATLDSLRPPSCEDGSSLCASSSKFQIGFLYFSAAVVSIGLGGTRFTLATMGANQLEKHEDRAVFFNWYFFTAYSATVISSTAIVYVQDNVSWGLGFGLCAAASFIGLVVFLAGKRFYRRDEPPGSPFGGLARVVVACVTKRKVMISSTTTEDYYYGEDANGQASNMLHGTNTKPSNNFRFLNKAAVKTEGDLTNDGKISKPWKLCTVQQVEDLKALLRIFPLWLSVLFLSTPIAIQASLTVLQALTMDRHVGPHFQIPAGSMLVITLITTSAFLTVLDRLLLPAWQSLTRHSPTPLQRIGVGHAFNILSMAVSALVESKRLKIAHENPDSKVAPMLALWLFPQLVLVGLGEAFHFPGQVALYYQEFPASLRSTSTAMVSMAIGICYYLSTAVIDLVRRATAWLPADDINTGRLDNTYWLVTVLGVLNFGYYLVCAKLYKYQHNVDSVDKEMSLNR